MEAKVAKAALAASSLAVLLALGGCGDRVDDERLPDQASVEINRQGMEGAKEESAGIGVRNDGNEEKGFVHSLGAKGDTSVMDPDVLIAERVKAALASNPDFGAAKVDVYSKEGEVTLRGQAPDPTAKERATEIARTIPNVRSVDNQLTLG